jgi:acetyl esterase/lipase
MAALLYLLVALWAMRAVLPAPAATLPVPASLEADRFRVIWQDDQRFVAAAVAGNARRILTTPWNLFESGFCHPTPHAVTLGEHMFGSGLLGVPAYLLSGDPIVTMNVVSLLALWLPAVTMYALAYHWTRSAGAAFVAGLLFAFHPVRVGNPAKPFLHANQWTPLVLLFAHRLFVRRRWRDAAGLVLCTSLQLLESFYQVLALLLVGGTWVAFLVVHHRRRLRALAPKLLACTVAGAGMATLLFAPYLETRAVWGSLQGRPLVLPPLAEFAPGRAAYPGSVALGLAAIALLDRIRRRRPRAGLDPRLAYLAGGLLLLWAVVDGVPIPGLGIDVPSLSTYLRHVVPGLDAGRGLARARLGVYLVVAFLAGYGVLVLTEGRRRVARLVAVGLFSGAALLEVLWPPLARSSFAHSVELRPAHMRPAAGVLALYAEAAPGGVVDVPLRRRRAGEYLLLAAYHGRPVAACYNSYAVPIVADVEALAARLPDRAAADALYALGFRTLVVHEERLLPKSRPEYLRSLDRLPSRFVLVGRSAHRSLYRIESPAPVEPGFSGLEAGSSADAVTAVMGPPATLEFTFRNRSPHTYRHPDPIRPTPLLAEWQAGSAGRGATFRIDGLLPLALASGEAAARAFTVPVPDGPGRYEVTLAPAEEPALVIARQTVELGATPSASTTAGRGRARPRRQSAVPLRWRAKPPPDLRDVAYGPHARNVLDLWRAPSAEPTPLAVHVHGGAFRVGSKQKLRADLLQALLEAGISVAAIDYRHIDDAPFPAPMSDAARAVQFLRHRAPEWNLDPARVAAVGASAGGGIALWIGLHDDLAEAASADPVARESTRLAAVAATAAQTSYDPRFIRQVVGGRAHEHPMLRSLYGLGAEDVVTAQTMALYAEASPINHVSPDDPAVLLLYPRSPSANAPPGRAIHHRRFGEALEEKLGQSGVPCVLRDLEDREGVPTAWIREVTAFLAEHLRRSEATTAPSGIAHPVDTPPDPGRRGRVR